MNGLLRKLLLAGLVSAAFGVAACRSEEGRVGQANERSVIDDQPAATVEDPGAPSFGGSGGEGTTADGANTSHMGDRAIHEQGAPATGGSGEAGTDFGAGTGTLDPASDGRGSSGDPSGMSGTDAGRR